MIFKISAKDIDRTGQQRMRALQSTGGSILVFLTNVIDVDIEGFFEQINHEKLASFVMERITDGYVIKLIREWLRAGVVYMGETSKLS
jgi:retron-type reverse transcriptase